MRFRDIFLLNGTIIGIDGEPIDLLDYEGAEPVIMDTEVQLKVDSDCVLIYTVVDKLTGVSMGIRFFLG